MLTNASKAKIVAGMLGKGVAQGTVDEIFGNGLGGMTTSPWPGCCGAIILTGVWALNKESEVFLEELAKNFEPVDKRQAWFALPITRGNKASEALERGGAKKLTAFCGMYGNYNTELFQLYAPPPVEIKDVLTTELKPQGRVLIMDGGDELCDCGCGGKLRDIYPGVYR